MRISTGMMSGMVMSNLSGSLDRLYNLNSQMSSGKRILKASDDPVGTSQSLSLRGAISRTDQYLRNVDRAKTQMSLTDGSLKDVTTALNESKRLALMGANATTSPEQRDNLALQVQQQIDNIVQSMSATQSDHYIFSGNQMQNAPVLITPGVNGGPPTYTYNGDDGKMQAQVSDATEITASITAKEVLNFGGAVDATRPDVLTNLQNLKQALIGGDSAGIQTAMAGIDKDSQTVLAQRGKVGTRVAQMDLYANRLADSKNTQSEWLSKTEDADITDVLSKLQQEQNVYQASLIAAARLGQQSLADYLK